MKILILALSFLFWGAEAMAQEPKPFSATYQVLKSGITLGEMNARFTLSGANYQYDKQTKASGVVAMISGDQLTERSLGHVKNGVVNTHTYRFEHKNRRKTKVDQFRVNAKGKVTGQYKDKVYPVSAPAGLVDPASLELRIMSDIAAGKPLNYHVFERGEHRSYRFDRLGSETIKVPSGSYLCEKIRVSRKGGLRSTTVWLAKSLGFLPVKLRHVEGKDTLETRLKTYRTL